MIRTATAPQSASGAVLRPARKVDAAALAVLVDIAGEGLPAYLWSVMKPPGQSAIEFGRARAARDSGGFSYAHGLVAEIDGEVAGALIDYRLDDPYDLSEVGELPEVVQPLVRLEGEAPGSWYVNVLATFSEFRGRGIGTRLLAAAAERAHVAAVPALSIIVAEENRDAARLYARVGFRERARRPVVAFPGCPHGGDWLLMVKPTG